MSTASPKDYTPQLQRLMQRASLSSFKALCQKADVSRRQITQLRTGRIKQMQLENLLRLSQVLGVSPLELLAIFSEQSSESRFVLDQSLPERNRPDVDSSVLQQEYQQLQNQLDEQRQMLWQEFQQATLQTLESFLLQWPTAAYAARQNPQAPAVKLLPLLRPIEQLLQEWGIKPIGAVGTVIPYDPQLHQLMEGSAQLGELVKIRYAGYCQDDKLLYRAKVSPVPANK